MPKRWWRGIFPRRRLRRYEWGDTLQTILDNMAILEERPQEQVHEELIASGLARHASEEDLRRHWQGFTDRERQVVALLCSGYTNRQIGSRLGIANSTIKTHVRHALRKLRLRKRADLRLLFAGWDFSEWDR